MTGEQKTFGMILQELYKKESLKHPYGYSMTQWSRDIYGINNQAMSSYMNDVRRPTGENLELFVDVHGKKVYEWLGEPVPEDYNEIRRLAYRKWKHLSLEAQQEIGEVVRRDLAKKPKATPGG